MNLLQRIFRRNEPLGARGERLAASYLRSRGYRILERNLQVRDDEADLLALDADGRTIVIVEVKTRAADDGIAPEAAINARKQQHLTRLALNLQQQARFRDQPFRFDAIAVVLPRTGEPVIRHIVSAFDAR